jgi:hypothetical protein
MNHNPKEAEDLKKRSQNFTYTLSEIINQLKHVNPTLKVYGGKLDRWMYDPNGLIERIATRLFFAFTQRTRVDGLVDGLYFERGGKFDHLPVLTFLEEALANMEKKSFTSNFSLRRFYVQFRKQLWDFKMTGV